MELLAVIVALEQLKKNGSQVTVYSDSRYVCEPVNQQWLFEWERKGFKKRSYFPLRLGGFAALRETLWISD